MFIVGKLYRYIGSLKRFHDTNQKDWPLDSSSVHVYLGEREETRSFRFYSQEHSVYHCWSYPESNFEEIK